MRILILMVLIVLCTSCHSQIKRDAKGNYIAVKHNIDSLMKAKAIGKKSGYTYTDTKGIVYDVYLSPNGKPFVNKVSKNTGKTYKYYLKVE